MNHLTKTFPSKITYWIYLVIAAFMLYFFIKAIIDAQWFGVIILAIAFGGVLLPMLLNTKYTITDGVLNVHSGFLINTDITIANIKTIKATNSIMSAPALSFDRIEIFYNRFDSVVISPKNKIEFIEMLKQINPAIVSEL